MKLTADTNLLLRFVTPDDADQQDIVIEALKTADRVAISVHVLREMAWVMERRYGAA
ncbi:hypothetical protein [Methylobacterium sp. J-077]|uniref:hypothetical protein n=1 Tax=Methylobacterium sp. J-077 TaxID=2836656 RepID=UPI001FBADB9C|nr:hypothetical protein [Methylobacterium sp. J-077]MCJ2124304.1 hypothetical protein [Methylobacterium sp. J-077]